jgi:hypothetical protein
MRFLSILTTTLSVMAGLVAAGQNAIIYPGTNAQINAGTTIEITWTPTAGAKITLKLMYGQTQDLQTGTTIACKFPTPLLWFEFILHALFYPVPETRPDNLTACPVFLHVLHPTLFQHLPSHS